MRPSWRLTVCKTPLRVLWIKIHQGALKIQTRANFYWALHYVAGVILSFCIMCVLSCMYVEAKGGIEFLHLLISTLLFEASSLTEHGTSPLTRLAGRWDLGIPSAGIMGVCPPAWLFCGCWESKHRSLGSHIECSYPQSYLMPALFCTINSQILTIALWGFIPSCSLRRWSWVYRMWVSEHKTQTGF